RVGRDGVGLGRRRTDLDALGVHVELPGQAEQLNQGATSRSHRVPRGDRRLGLDVEDQLVEVRALLDTGRLDLVAHLQNRRVDRVDRNPADLGTGLLVLHRGDIATTTLDDKLNLQLALCVQGGDVEIRVVHRDTGRRHDVSGGDLTRALLAQVHRHRLVLFGADHQLLDVQDDVGDVLLHTRNGGELVQHTVDAQA